MTKKYYKFLHIPTNRYVTGFKDGNIPVDVVYGINLEVFYFEWDYATESPEKFIRLFCFDEYNRVWRIEHGLGEYNESFNSLDPCEFEIIEISEQEALLCQLT